MTELLTTVQMKALEQAAIDSGIVTGLDLMACAGQGVVEATFEVWPELAEAPHRAVILCGPGNNGGDGYVIARLLLERGWQVALWRTAPPSDRAPDAQACERAWRGHGARPIAWSELMALPAPDLVVDAVFGIGQTRCIPAPVADIIRLVRETWADAAIEDGGLLRRVAVDVPSGLCCGSGKPLRPKEEPRTQLSEGWPSFMDWTFAADLTVTFHAPKLGHYVGAGPALCGAIGQVWLPGLAISDSALGLPVSVPGHVRLVEPVLYGEADTIAVAADLIKRTEHKYTHGHALVLTGGMGRTGAARLAARGALRVGAGLVTLGAPGAAMMECACQITGEMLRRCDEAEGLAALLEDGRINAVCLGPGLGLEPRTREMVAAALAPDGSRAVVLDADALTSFADRADALFDLCHDRTVLTPHGGEFARLFPDIAAKLAEPPTKGPAYSKVDATREAAARAGCVVLYKGPDTVIADPKGRCSIHAAVYERAAPWLATAGSGDVLAGIITGLLARGLMPMQAAEYGAWLHVEAARQFGPGLIAEDLPEALPAVFRAIGV